MNQFGKLTAKIYSYLTDDGSEDKKSKSTKQCVIKRKPKLEDYKSCLKATQLNLEKTKIYIDNSKEFIKNGKLISKIQKWFKTEWHNAFTEEIKKIALSSNDDKKMQTIDSIETYAYGKSKDLVSDNEEIKCNNNNTIPKKINFDDVVKESIEEHKPNWSQIPDHPYKI